MWKWLDAIKTGASPVDLMRLWMRVADRLKNNARLRATVRFASRLSGVEPGDDGRWHLRADPAHRSCRFRPCTGWTKSSASGNG